MVCGNAIKFIRSILIVIGDDCRIASVVSHLKGEALSNKSKRPILIFASSAVAAFSILFSLCIGELAIRAIHLMRDGIPFFERTAGRIGPIQLDPELGWRATENYEESLTRVTKHGKTYSIHRSQRRHGFRHFGDPRSPKPKLLVIGDSYTQAAAVSDTKTYPALLSRQLGMELFAYGAGGYGTLQEYLILDRYFDEIRPDLILWQFCVNDFINNDNELEQTSTMNNNGLTRPYWVNGAIAHLSPTPAWRQVREWINHHSRFLYFVVSRVDRVRAVTATASVEAAIEADGFRHTGFRRAAEVTDELMSRVRARAGQTPIVAINCDKGEPYDKAFAAISAHHGIEYWDDVPDVIHEALTRGEDVLTPDDHWNELGHELVAGIVVRHMRARGPIVARHRAHQS